MKNVLVTGAAGFIGFHVIRSLLNDGYNIHGIDNLNEYYDVNLKLNRLKELNNDKNNSNFEFLKLDLCEKNKILNLFEEKKFDIVINLAAQAGVRYSLINPEAYLRSNLEGFLNILEGCRHSKVENLIYASSSSVYGTNTKLPFSEEDSVDHPISLYAATKKSNELMAHTYSHLFNIPTTGLRFFTVYGPWGRPDMAMYIFAEAISSGKPIKLFNNGNMLRDFTYVNDVVESILRLCQKPAQKELNSDSSSKLSSSKASPFKIFNIGNNSPIVVSDLIQKIENFFGKKAIIHSEPIQPGDVQATYADTSLLQGWVDFKPKTSIDDGLFNFLNWFKAYKCI